MRADARSIPGVEESIPIIGGNNGWRLLGPGGGGAQFTPVISPHDPNKILVACDMTGAYITCDGGLKWSQFNLRSRVHSFCFDPVDSDTIYAGSSGLFRSEDGGNSWRLIFPKPELVTGERMLGDHAEHSYISLDNYPGGEVRYIRVDDHDNAQLFIAIYDGGELLVHHSADRGSGWSQICEITGNEMHFIYPDRPDSAGDCCVYCFTDKGAFCIKTGMGSGIVRLRLPENTVSIIHASFGMDTMTGSPVFYIITSLDTGTKNTVRTAVWKSEDRGQSWSRLRIQLRGETDSCMEGQVSEREDSAEPVLGILAVPQKDARYVYAGVANFPEIRRDTGAGSINSYFGAIKSNDGGRTWNWVLKSDYAEDPQNLETGWAERDYDLPWHMTGPKGVGPIGLGVCPANPDVCCATDLSSTFLTVDGGIHWKQVYSIDNPDSSVSSRGMEVTTCYGVHFDPFERDHIAVSYTDIGMFHSKDSGRAWFHSIKGLPVAWGNTCYWIVFDPDIRGRTWSAWGGAHDLPRPKMFKSGRFHTYEGGVCKSEDGMASWRISNGGMPGNSVTTHISIDASSPPGSRTLYATVFDKGVYKSVDDGAFWNLKNKGICGNLNAWRTAVLPDGMLYLLVARGLRNSGVVDGAVYRSRDGAEHWEKISLPPGVNAPNDLVYDPCRPERMYLACWPSEAGQYGGIYTTDDGGDSWECIFDSSAHVYGVAVHPGSPSVLFAVTFDSAAWFSEDRGETWRRLEGYDFKWGHRPAVDPYNGNMLYITTFGSSIWYGPWRAAEE